MSAPSKLPAAPWVWRSFGGPLMLVTAHSGAQVVLAPGSCRGRPSRPDMLARDDEGVLRVMTADHPVARLLQAAPQMLAALELAEGALAVRGSLRDGEQVRVQMALETVRQVLAIARPDVAEVAP